ncbi:hypothetical protein Tco_1369835 [Tanacetum coccineum]
MSSASSAVTYTSVYTDSEPGSVFWGADEEISDGGCGPRVVSQCRGTDVRGLWKLVLHGDRVRTDGDNLVGLRSQIRRAQIRRGHSKNANTCRPESVDGMYRALRDVEMDSGRFETSQAGPSSEASYRTGLARRLGQQRARQPGLDARILDHHDASKDADSHIYYDRIKALQRNSTNGDGSHSSYEDNRRNVQTARPCFYADFMKCQPLNFKGTEGVVGLTRWIEKMDSVFNINGCAIKNQVKFATCTLLGAALTWWNSQGEIKKLKIELWNLKVKGTC